MAQRRDLTVTIDGDSRGFRQASKRAQRAARAYEQEIDRLNARMVQTASIGATMAPPIVTGTAAMAAGMGAAASAAGTLAAAGGTVALAMSGLGDALDALNQASLNPTEQNMQAVGEALRQLSPAGRDFVLFLDDLQPKLEDLQTVAQQGLLPGVGTGIQEALGLFPELRNLVDTTATALGDLAAEGGAALNAPFWENYINFLSAQARPTIEQFGAVLGNVAEGFAGMQMAFGDLQLDMGRGLQQLSEQFATFGTQLGESQGFEQFVGYVRQVTPQILSTVGSIAEALGAVAEAAAPIGPAMLAGIEGLADVLHGIASIPVVGTTLISVAAGMTAVNRAMKLYQATQGMQLLTSLEGYGRTGQRASRGLRRAAGGLRAFGGAVTAAAVAIQLTEEDLSGYVQQVETAGGVTQSTEGQLRNLKAELQRQQQTIDNAALTWQGLGGGISLTSNEAASAMDKVPKLKNRIKQLKNQTQQANPRVQVLANKFGLTDEEATDAMRAVGNLDSELQSFFDLSFGVQEAQDKVTRGFQQLEQQVKDASGKLQGNSEAAVANRKMMRQLTRDTGSLMVKEAQHSDSLEDVKSNTQQNIDRFRNYARRIGLNDEAVKNYTDRLKEARIDVINKFKTEGLGKVKEDVVELHDNFVDLGGTYAARLEGGGLGPKFRATGGAIQGPGGPREDRIPVMASNNEHMWTASEVAGAGGHQTVEALRKLAASGRLPGLANGGPVTTNTMVNANPLARDLSQSPLMNMNVGGFSGNVSQWADESATALRMLGQPLSLVNNVLKLIRTESGGDPNAINLWDINARMGMPSQGLIQVIPPTFAAHRHGALGGITDPLANLYAGLNYALDRYGSLTDSDIYVGGYDRGGMLPKGLSMAYNGTGSGEHQAVFTDEQWRSLRTVAQAVNSPAVTRGGDGASSVNYTANFYGPVQQPRDSREAVLNAFHDLDTLHPVGSV